MAPALDLVPAELDFNSRPALAWSLAPSCASPGVAHPYVSPAVELVICHSSTASLSPCHVAIELGSSRLSGSALASCALFSWWPPSPLEQHRSARLAINLVGAGLPGTRPIDAGRPAYHPHLPAMVAPKLSFASRARLPGAGPSVLLAVDFPRLWPRRSLLGSSSSVFISGACLSTLVHGRHHTELWPSARFAGAPSMVAPSLALSS